MPRFPVSRHARLALLATTIAVLSLSGVASARTWVIPHVLERSGSTGSTQFTFDTQMFATYTPGLGGDTDRGSSATLDFYLYDQNGLPMQSASAQEVCNPCSWVLGDDGLGTNVRKQSILVDNLIVAAGGFDVSVKLGFGVIVVGGSDPDGVALQGFIVNSHTSAFDLSVFGFEPQPIAATASPLGASSKTFVMPHVFEKSGRTSNTQYTFDTQMFATYTAGLAGLPPGGGATLDLYLYDEAGIPWIGPIGEICNPCSYALSDAQRKRSISLEDLILTAGGFGGSPVLSGFAIAVVSGDVDHVSLQGFVVNSHTGPFDVSVFGFTPEEVRTASNVAVIDPDRRGAALALRGSPNPSRGDIVFSYQLADAADVKLDVFDAAGRRVASVLAERRDAGAGVARWDRRDESGNRLPSGIYYGRLSAGDGSRVTKVVFLPN